MPCRNDDFIPPSQLFKMNRNDLAKIDELTKLLCETCKAGKPTHDTLIWYKQHELADKMRESEELSRANEAIKKAEIALEKAKAAAKKILKNKE